MSERLTKKHEDGEIFVPRDMVSILDNGCVGKPITKLAEYEDLDEQELLVKLPCKVGSDVYYILGIPNETHCVIESCVFELSDIHKIGKTLFLTHEEAEAKLEELQKGGVE